MTGRRDVVVLGAGPAGLMAALALARAGRRVTVLEAAPRPGGLAASFEVAGVRVDHGSHRLHRACPPAVLAMLRDLLGDDLQRRRRRGRIRLAGRWVRFPPRPLDLVRNLPPGFALRVARDAGLAPTRRAHGDTFAAVVRARLGPTMADEFYAPYVRKIWGEDPDALAGELARRRVSATSAVELLRRLRDPDPDAGTFLYPRRGFGQIVEALAAAAVAAGAELVVGARVERVGTDGEVVAAGRSWSAPQVWSTIPARTLLETLDPVPGPEVLAAARRLRSRGLVLLYLALDRPHWTTADAHYFPDASVMASRVSEPTRYRDGAGSDPPDRTVLCAEIPCTPGDVLWRTDPGALAERLAKELAACGLDEPVPSAVEVRRVAHAYPVYERGFEAAWRVVDDHLARMKHLLTFGRQGLFAHDNTHHSLAMALAAVDALGDGPVVDRDRWAAARATFAEHVVED